MSGGLPADAGAAPAGEPALSPASVPSAGVAVEHVRRPGAGRQGSVRIQPRPVMFRVLLLLYLLVLAAFVVLYATTVYPERYPKQNAATGDKTLLGR